MIEHIRRELLPALKQMVVWTLLLGLAYPLIMTALAQVLFPVQANGSLIEAGGKVVGSELVGQTFDDPKYFWGRLSAASYNGAGSSGSNLAPTNPALLDNVKARLEALKKAGSSQTAAPPVDLVTASGSGLDPHISPAAAHWQAERVAKVRGLSVSEVKSLIDSVTEPRQLGVLGEPRVNVLKLNLALDKTEWRLTR